MKKPIQIGVSKCLLGDKVRWDGGHKKNSFITNVLANYFEFISFCPEVECGLPTPRETMRLEGDLESPQLITNKTKKDLTQHMQAYSTDKTQSLKSLNLCGLILKKDSPSCGLHRVKVYTSPVNSVRQGRGIFAATFSKALPYLPMEEEGRLQDAALKENFLERVFCHHRWNEFLENNPTYKELVAFHTQHKLLIMSHSIAHYKYLGKLVAKSKEIDRDILINDYYVKLMQALSIKATVRKHRNVLLHIMGHFKRFINEDEKAELLELINRFANGTAPLIVPLTLVNHYVRKYNIEYLSQQYYLNSHPGELMLRNNV
ncbi:DUF523 and DUF1722 domain-containing protein [Proteinivorax hydrogeniformans]|uniref:DUF523 and DUF1722 domain-containing protein n=1 Tax=Proteinivorax hydrogeniformans TaxID=1826727 RepID=A0AAU8HUJ8_9FIRM